MLYLVGVSGEVHSLGTSVMDRLEKRRCEGNTWQEKHRSTFNPSRQVDYLKNLKVLTREKAVFWSWHLRHGPFGEAEVQGPTYYLKHLKVLRQIEGGMSHVHDDMLSRSWCSKVCCHDAHIRLHVSV